MLPAVVVLHFMPRTIAGFLAANAVWGIQRNAKNNNSDEKRYFLKDGFDFITHAPFPVRLLLSNRESGI